MPASDCPTTPERTNRRHTHRKHRRRDKSPPNVVIKRDKDDNRHGHSHSSQKTADSHGHKHDIDRDKSHKTVKRRDNEHEDGRRHRRREDEGRSHSPAKHVKRERDDHGYADERRSGGQDTRPHNRRRDVKTEREIFMGGRNADDNHVYGKPTVKDEAKKDVKKDKPNFELSGKLTEDANTFRGVVIQYSEPAEARRPKRRWRLYPFKGEETLPLLHIHRQSAYLIGRDRRVADIPVDHPSCSKQHAALQYRLVSYKRPDGRPGRRVRLYVIDLGSANGTYVNAARIDAKRYVELLEKDVIKFGYSSREYVLLHEKTDTSELHSDEDDEGVDDNAAEPIADIKKERR